MSFLSLCVPAVLFSFLFFQALSADEPLPGTAPLTWTGDSAVWCDDNIGRFLDRKTEESVLHRPRYWNGKFADRSEYETSVEPNRERLRFILGVRDDRVPFESPCLSGTLETPALLAETPTHRIYAIRWPVLELFSAEGLLLEPKTEKVTKTIIHLPHADDDPEKVLGLEESEYRPGFETAIENNRVVIPAMLDREFSVYGRVTLTHREYVYRMAFQVGRHPIGYEIQGVLALVDWLKRKDAAAPVRVEGYGDGGMIALYAGAVDSRIDEVLVAGYFDNRNRLHDEPIDRNVFGLLEQFGDAELASLIAPRKLVVVNRNAPELTLLAGKGGAPGVLKRPRAESVRTEIERAKKIVAPFQDENWIKFEPESVVAPVKNPLRNCLRNRPDVISVSTNRPDPVARRKRLLDGMTRHAQDLLEHSEMTRRAFWSKLDTSSPEAFEKSKAFYRDYFAREIIGVFEDEVLPPSPKTKLFQKHPDHRVYEVELDVFDGLSAYGLLLIPNGIAADEKRPVVICQHGRGGRPQHVLRGGNEVYRGYATTLCEQGYVVFAPQNSYPAMESFRLNQRKLNPLGKTQYSVMLAQNRQIVDWLATLPMVDADRIGYYGLSYGGKTAMRLPPLIDKIGPVVCSGDFNHWNKKVASNWLPFSFVLTEEYEIYEFDLAGTYDYGDMAALIAPRPFMVERGHVDGVGRDEYVGFEYARVRNLYKYLLKIPDRTEIHWFDGGHRIDGEKAIPFLDRFLKTPNTQNP